MLAECSSLNPANPASASRKVLETVQRGVQFASFRFTHLATAQGDKGTLAVVRAKVSYSATVRGVVEPLSFGLLGVMKKEGAGWKVAALVPDDLLNLEEFAATSGALAAEKLPGASALDLKTMNQMITDAMKGGYVHQEKLEVAIAMGVVGQFGPVGDLAANSYQVYDTLKNITETVSEVWANGFSPIGYVKAEQIAVGIFQIVSEPVPGMDAFADSIQANLEQFGYNLEIMRGLQQLKYQLYKAPADGLRFSPQLALLEPFQFTYPPGMEISGDPEVVHAAGTPVRSIFFKTPHSVGHRLPLRVLGEMPIEKGSPLYLIADRLGGKLRGATYYIPVDVTHLVSGELASGDILLDNYGRYRGEKSGTRLLLWDVNCRRGRELLRVSLRNGETTPVVNIVNWFMNVITEFRLTGLDTGNQFKLKVGEERAFTVTGASSLLEQSFWPNLTNWPTCFDMAVRTPATASLERGATSKLKGVAKGSTELVLLLPSSAGDTGVSELMRSIPVLVEEEVLFPRFKGIYFSVSTWAQVKDQLSGKIGSTQPVDISNDLGRDDFLSAFTSRSGILFKRLTFTGNSFRTDPTRFSQELTSGAQAGIRISGEIEISGTLDPVNRRLVSLKGRVLVINECCRNDGYTRKSEKVKELEFGPLAFNASFSESGARATGPEVLAAARRISWTMKVWSSGKLVEDWVTTSIAPSTDGIPRLDISFSNSASATEVP